MSGRLGLVLGLVPVMSACALELGQWYKGAQADGGPDSSVSDAGREPGDHRALGPWSAPDVLFVPAGPFDDDPELTDDGLVLVFECRPPEGQTLCVATRSRVDQPLDSQEVLLSPTAFAEIIGDPTNAYRLGTPALYDGSLYFEAEVVDTEADQIFVAGFRDGELTTPPTVADIFDVFLRDFANPSFARGGTVVMVQRGGSELVEIVIDGNTFEAVAHPELDVPGFRTVSPALSPDARTLYFARDRGGAAGESALWYAERGAPGEPFAPPIPISELDIEGSREIDPHVSRDGRRLVFVERAPSETRFLVAER